MRIFPLLLSAVFATAAQSREAPLSFMSNEEPVMQQAFAKARSTLAEFLKLAESRPAGLENFAVKVGIGDSNGTEYFWITDFTQNGERLVGKIGNTPQMVKTVKLDQMYEFRREQVVDWLYLDRKQRKMVGNFTYCALLTKEPPAEAEAAKKRYRLDCE
jgi:uncharacterized protein YegJ (DUF2314 family)